MNNILEMTEQEIWDLFESKSFTIGNLDYLIKNDFVKYDPEDDMYIDRTSNLYINEEGVEELQNLYNDPEHTFVEQIEEIDMEDESFLFALDDTSCWYPLSLIIPMDCHIGLIHLDIPDEETFLL